MDCRAALEILEVVRPDSADRTEPEVVSASAHVENCPRCEDRFQLRQEFDRRIADQMRAVPVPANLEARLLASLAEIESEIADEQRAGSRAADVAATVPDRRHRARGRARLVAVASAALCLFAAVTFFVAQLASPARWTLAELRHEARTAFEYESLPQFAGTFQPLLPELGWQASRSIHLSREPGGFPPDITPHAAAVYRFVLAGPRPVQGLLLVTPKRLVDDPPDEQFFNPRGIGSGPLSTVAWTEGDLVYVCVISGGGDSLDRLYNALRNVRAA